MTTTQVRRIDEVAAVFNGKTPSKSEQRGSGHPVLKIKDVDALGKFRGTFSGHVGADLAQKHVKQQLAGGETLVLNAAHSVTHVASKTFYADQEVAGSLATGEWLIIRWCTESVDSRFGNHWINAPDTRFRIRRLVNGIHLYPKDVARLQIPLPPSTSRSGLRGFWMRRTPCGPSAARPSPSSTPSSNPPSSTCSATPSPIQWGGRW